METDVGDGGKGDLMRVRDLDGYGVEIGRCCKPPWDDRENHDLPVAHGTGRDGIAQWSATKV
jgi:hypothetical protein